jgi:hypothetical protein
MEDGPQPMRYQGDDDDDRSAIRLHFETFFDRDGEELTWPHGPAGRLGAFRVLQLPPNEQTPFWTYASIGAFALGPPGTEPLELLLLTPGATGRGVELVTLAAEYHHARGLALGHRLSLGEPWLAGATCDAFLVSLPHPFASTVRTARAGGRTVHVRWLLPITPGERRFAAEQGVAALEQRFDDAPVDYGRPDRPSCV